MRFSIRDLLFLTVIVALAVGWGIQTVRHAALQSEYKSLRQRFDTAKALAQEIAQLTIEEGGDGIRVTMPAGWPRTLLDQWQPIPAPSPSTPGVEHPVARRR